jgi:hypothetical protein
MNDHVPSIWILELRSTMDSEITFFFEKYWSNKAAVSRVELPFDILYVIRGDAA